MVWACVIDTGDFKYTSACYNYDDLARRIESLGPAVTVSEVTLVSKDAYDEWRAARVTLSSEIQGPVAHYLACLAQDSVVSRTHELRRYLYDTYGEEAVCIEIDRQLTQQPTTINQQPV